MEEETGGKDTIVMQDSTETVAVGNPRDAEGQRSPTWRGWVLSILVAVLLSVTATMILGGSGAFRPDRPAASGTSGAGRSCCPTAEGNP